MMHQTHVTRKVGGEDMGSSGRRFFLADDVDIYMTRAVLVIFRSQNDIISIVALFPTILYSLMYSILLHYSTLICI